jgi:hypothetical protein
MHSLEPTAPIHLFRSESSSGVIFSIRQDQKPPAANIKAKVKYTQVEGPGKSLTDTAMKITASRKKKKLVIFRAALVNIA